MSSFGEMSMSAEYLRDYRDSVLDEFERDLQEIEDNEVDEQTRRDNTRRIEQKRDKFEESINKKSTRSLAVTLSLGITLAATTSLSTRHITIKTSGAYPS